MLGGSASAGAAHDHQNKEIKQIIAIFQALLRKH
jgi:hypothetical protein